jgi:hypothetical protein
MNPVSPGPTGLTVLQIAPARAQRLYESTGYSTCKDPASYGAVSTPEDLGLPQSVATSWPSGSEALDQARQDLLGRTAAARRLLVGDI